MLCSSDNRGPYPLSTGTNKLTAPHGLVSWQLPNVLLFPCAQATGISPEVTGAVGAGELVLVCPPPDIRLRILICYEAALLPLGIYNSIPNITVENNIFSYSADNGETWKTIALDTGADELAAINNKIKRQLTANGDSDNVISITANVSRLTSIVDIENPSYKADFSVENSICSLS